MAYAIPQVHRKAIVGGAQESVSGTAEAVTAALAATYTYDPRCEPMDLLADGKRTPGGLYLGNIQSLVGLRRGRISFSNHITSGDATAIMLTSCGYRLATGAYKPTTDWTYRFTWTFAEFTGGVVTPAINAVKKIIHGCAGNFTLTLKPGAPAVMEWEQEGIWNAPTDVTAIAGPTVSSLPYICTGMTLTFPLGTVPVVDEIRIRSGNQIVLRRDVTAASGIGHAYIASREPVIEFAPEARLCNVIDDYAGLLASTQVAFQAILKTSDGVTAVTIDAPAVQRASVVDAEREGLRTRDIQLQCNASAGDDELSFTFA